MQLAVNVDHIATIREARQVRDPDPVAAAILAEVAGAQGITVHLRTDRRHIKERDVEVLRKVVRTKLNVELAATAEMIDVILPLQPDQVTLVPERPQEVTTEGGLDVVSHVGTIAEAVRRLRDGRIKVSLFIDPDLEQVKRSKDVGADAIEINTGPYTEAPTDQRPAYLGLVSLASEAAAAAGLEVLAGHGLNYFNVQPITHINLISELNIGHSIVARAALVGMERAVADMVALLRG